MKTSLRQKANDLIRARGWISYDEIRHKCEQGYFGRYFKISNLERRLRKSESPDIDTDYKDGHIVAYRWSTPVKYQTARVINPLTGECEKIIKLPLPSQG